MKDKEDNSQGRYPDSRGYYGSYGGRFVPESLMSALLDLEQTYSDAQSDPEFNTEYIRWLTEYAGRPTPLTFANRLTTHYGGPKIFLKREDLCYTGAHKINNTIGQILLAKRAGKKRVVAETGAGQHGVAAATVAAKMGIECVVYMGEEDVLRQKLNVHRMRLLGAHVEYVQSGSRTLVDATSEALRDWAAHADSTFYIMGSCVGPHPYPMMVRNFQSVIGEETKSQLLSATGRDPSLLLACIGGGSNAVGLFFPFLKSDVKMVGVEAGGLGTSSTRHAATLADGTPGVFHGSFSYVLQDDVGEIKQAHSIAAGLDYPGVGPELSALKDAGRVVFASVTDREAITAANLLASLEGIIPALESAHALAHLPNIVKDYSDEDVIVVCLSGSGDKDIVTLVQHSAKWNG